MAGEFEGQAVSSAAPTAGEPGPSVPLEQQLTAAESSTPPPSSGDGAAPVASSAAPVAEWTGVRDYLKGKGVDLPFDNDAAALDNLAQAWRGSQQRDYYADLGRRIAPHAGAVREFLSRQQQGQQAATPQGPAPWAPPEFQKSWVNLVERDGDTGQLRSKAGYDPAIAEKVQRYADWREKFLESPDSVVGPLVEARASALIEERFRAHQEQQDSQSIVQREQDWLYRKDASGRPIRGQFTPEGVLFARTTQDLWNGGMRDVNRIASMARTVVENAVMRRSFQGREVPVGAPVAQMSNGAPSVGASLSGPGQAAATPPASQAGLSLRERLNAAVGAVEPAEY